MHSYAVITIAIALGTSYLPSAALVALIRWRSRTGTSYPKLWSSYRYFYAALSHLRFFCIVPLGVIYYKLLSSPRAPGDIDFYPEWTGPLLGIMAIVLAPVALIIGWVPVNVWMEFYRGYKESNPIPRIDENKVRLFIYVLINLGWSALVGLLIGVEIAAGYGTFNFGIDEASRPYLGIVAFVVVAWACVVPLVVLLRRYRRVTP